MKNGSLKVFSGTSNPALAESIGEALGIPLGEITVKRFKDGEIYVAYEENVRGTDCFLIQSTCEPVNAMLMELLIMVDAARRASASRITAVLPYYGYGRQDRKHRPRVAITAKLVATLLATAGADRVLTMDLHAGQIQGFFDIPLDNLYATSVLVEEIRKLDIEALTVVSPDLGSVKRARAVARFLE
ncbi:MAG: ribose-phosphate diphosphokinase, partial [Candidatus Omnitrophica bacterium]|nr:ribose-phosphate diphosphokinase [Candidatus Omnitrophota bacterium]